MQNKDIETALEYHEMTKHSEISIRTSHHYLDWKNKPRPFKVYIELPSIPLPQEFQPPEQDALECVSALEPSHQAQSVDIKTLAQVLFFSGGITREMKSPLGTYFMRAAPATGALYPIELYVICQDIPGLRAGVYHFGPGDFSLTEIRRGDYRAELAAATSDGTKITTSPVTIVFTSIAWRNAWKYQERSYRHWFWDSGVIAANLLATAISAGLPPYLILGFKDGFVNRLLCCQEKRESAVALAPIGIGLCNNLDSGAKSVSSHSPKVLPLSQEEADYPEIWKMHDASSLSSDDELTKWAKASLTFERQPIGTKGYSYSLQPTDWKEMLGEVILRRGSTRRFARKAISFEQLSTILRSSTRGIPVDFLSSGDSIIDTYLIANAVQGLTSGAYFFNRSSASVELLKSGEFRSISAYLCLEQPLFGSASTVIFLMAELEKVLNNFGNRGYRAAQFEGGVIAGKIHLVAYALGLGASGSTFYDDAVTEFFLPHADRKSAMIVVGVGVPDYIARPGRVLVGRLTKEQLKEAV